MKQTSAWHYGQVSFKTLGLLLAFVLVCWPSSAQQTKSLSDFKYQYKVGVLPFVDNTGSGGQDVGSAVGRAVQTELVHSTELVGRALKLEGGVNAEDVDGAKAAEIGRARKVDVVLVGTILEATSEQSDHTASGPSIFGQSLGGRAHSAKAVATLQGDLYNVTSGRLIQSMRATGRASDTKVGANVSTTLGSISTAGSSFQNSPIGKALQKAVAELVNQIAANQSKMVRYKSTEGDAPAGAKTEESAPQ